MMVSDRWDHRFLCMALQVAGWSKDPDEAVGCVIVSPDRRLWTGGYNGFPRGVEDSPQRLDHKSLKLEFTVHAELNAILNARRDLGGWTLYSTKSPCMECAKAMIQAGVVRIVCPWLDGASSWANEQRRALHLLNEAGVIILHVDREDWT